MITDRYHVLNRTVCDAKNKNNMAPIPAPTGISSGPRRQQRQERQHRRQPEKNSAVVQNPFSRSSRSGWVYRRAYRRKRRLQGIAAGCSAQLLTRAPPPTGTECSTPRTRRPRDGKPNREGRDEGGEKVARTRVGATTTGIVKILHRRDTTPKECRKQGKIHGCDKQ